MTKGRWARIRLMLRELDAPRANWEAYRFGTKVGGQGERAVVRGQAAGLTNEMYVNTTTKMIETAYPVF